MAYKRFFAFGCSFTRYTWTTWADIVAAANPDAEYYNLGEPGSGCNIMLSRIMQADQVYNFNEEDLVIVQWSGINRESRFLKEGWKHMVNSVHHAFAKTFIKMFSDPTHSCLTAYAAMKSVMTLLDSKHVTHYHLSMIPIVDFESTKDEHVHFKPVDGSELDVVKETYKSIIERVRPSYFEKIWNSDWESRPNRPDMKHHIFSTIRKDTHPTPEEHLMYIRAVLPEVEISTEIQDNVMIDNKKVLSQVNLPDGSVKCFVNNTVKRIVIEDVPSVY